MTSLNDGGTSGKFKITVESDGAERREHRRYDMNDKALPIDRWDGQHRRSTELGYLMDLSAGGLRVRTADSSIRADSHIRVRLEIPAYAGVCPFVDTGHGAPRPKNEWIGWLSVNRVQKIERDQYDIAGRLVDMDEMDRGMLGLYLSTHPLAA